MRSRTQPNATLRYSTGFGGGTFLLGTPPCSLLAGREPLQRTDCRLHAVIARDMLRFKVQLVCQLVVLLMRCLSAAPLDSKSISFGDGYTYDNISSLCTLYNALPRPEGAEVPRIYDCFLASHELDMMEIRIRETQQYVDGFVAVESQVTFTGRKKRLYVPKVRERLPTDAKRLLHHVVLTTLQGSDAWARERYQRDSLFTRALDSLPQSARPRTGDIIMLGDADEIPKPHALYAFKHCQGIRFPVAMQAVLQYYSFDRYSKTLWQNPKAALYPVEGFTASTLRTAHEHGSSLKVEGMPNSSWHCSSCFSHLSHYRQKTKSFSHSELDTPANNNAITIVQRIKEGSDLFGRFNGRIDYFKVPNPHFPKYILDHPTRFAYLLRRDVPDAGLIDEKLDLLIQGAEQGEMHVDQSEYLP